tara:strand:+ start:347 stop:2071 length:1725 start_codon:yes stop_codon:yes gene_type:complete
MFQKFVKNSKGLENNFVKIVKILIIIFMSFSVLVNFIPFFEGSNSYHYGIASILLVEEGITKSNPFLEKDGFLVENWLLTDQKEMIPMSGQGLITLGGIFYLIGGYFALYYLSPIFFIILLITSERIATNLFGKYVGLIVLILLSTSNLLFRNSIQLQTESIFCLMFILGAYFLIKFGKTNKSYLILIASTFFVISTTIRLSGIISFPLEFLILSIFIINNYLTNKKIKNKKSYQRKIKNIVTLSLAAIPWIIFFLFFFYGNISNFGEPVVIYGTLNESQNQYYDSSPLSLIEFEKSDFENVKQYGKYLLPYIFVGVYDNIENNFENILGQNWLGVISLIILSLIFIFSYKSKNKKLEMFVMILLIFSTIWFYASITSEERAEKGVPGRYVLPVFVLSSMIFGYGIERIFVNIRNKKWKRSKIFQLSLVSVLLVFVIISYYFTPSVTMLGQESYFKNPYDYKREFPLKENGINEKSIVVTSIGVRALEYNLIPFNPSSNKIITNESIESLNLLVKDYDVFVFKTPYNNNEIKTVSELEKKGFVFIDYSENFCSMETDIELLKSQKKCIFNKSIR